MKDQTKLKIGFPAAFLHVDFVLCESKKRLAVILHVIQMVSINCLLAYIHYLILQYQNKYTSLHKLAVHR